MWIRPLALAAGALFLAGPVYYALPVLGGALIIVGGVASLWAIATVVLPKVRRRNAYDLEDLRKVHEEEELRALDPDDALGEPERVVCLRCMNEYSFRLGACPRCGLSR